METRFEAPFADGVYAFQLLLPQVVELERTTETSILTIEERLRSGIGQDANEEFVYIGGGAATVNEIRHTIRLGLIGGNAAMVDGKEAEVGPLRARELLDAYTYPARPLAEAAALAWRILSSSIYGVRLKKKAEGADEPSHSEKDS